MNKLETLLAQKAEIERQIEELKTESPYKRAFEKLQPNYVIANDSFICQKGSKDMIDITLNYNLHTSIDSCEDTLRYIRRKLLAEYHGSRKFIVDSKNWVIEKYNGNWQVEDYSVYHTEYSYYFPTKERAENYLADCLKEELL